MVSNGRAVVSRETGQLFRAIESLQQWLQQDGTVSADSLVGNSAEMQAVYQLARQYARSSAPVLVSGESGTGKEGLAKMIHRLSHRSDMPYARVNCAAISEGLLESELFGHERGAFTGAFERRVGRFEWANGGTLLLDEVSEMPLPLQAKLLRVLEEAEFQRVGGNDTIDADVRVISTTNRNLTHEVNEGSFRKDLFYRVNVLELHVPPLRERPGDIAELTQYFVSRFCCEAESPIRAIEADAIESLMRYDWPGNVRELRNVLRRACLLAIDGVITSDLVGQWIQPATTPEMARDVNNMNLEEAERHLIVAAIERHQGNKSAAARDLGVTTRTLQNKVRRYRELGLLQ